MPCGSTPAAKSLEPYDITGTIENEQKTVLFYSPHYERNDDDEGPLIERGPCTFQSASHWTAGC